MALDVPLEILLDDSAVFAVNKPSGMLVHRGWADDGEIALEVAGRLAGGRLFPVHRLDRGTSGVLLFARDREGAAELGRAFEGGQIEKLYLALVRGLPPAEGLVDHPIPRREDGPRVPARTRFRTLSGSTKERCALVAACPETGRLHQIRRHLKHINHPIVGDVNYGKGDINRLYREKYALRRLALHARELVFPHPVSRERVRVVAPLPTDLAGPLEALGVLDLQGASLAAFTIVPPPPDVP